MNSIVSQLEALLDPWNAQLPVRYAGLSNAIPVLRQLLGAVRGLNWVGFYVVDSSSLLLGPFFGNVACVRISYDAGVCGTAWKEKKSILVPDVRLFSGHIACDANSRSELVVPIVSRGQVVALIDADSVVTEAFSLEDAQVVEQAAAVIAERLFYVSAT